MGNSLSDYNLSKVQSNIERGNLFLDSYPYQVHFLMIDKCNVKCIMCGGDYFRSKSGKKITLEKFKTIAANLKIEQARAIVLAGAGDPLLNRDLVPIIRFVRGTYPQISISVTTNGLALTEKLSGLLLETGVSLVNISINSATRASYRRIMQVDGFDAVCRNAKSFVGQRNRSGRPTVLQFSAAINRLNIEDLPRLVELAGEIGVNSINLFYTRFYPERIRHLNIEDPADRLENDASLFFHQDLSDEMVLKAKVLAQQYRIDLMHEPLFRDHAPSCTCTWPMSQVMVGFNGEIYPCGGSEVHFREKVEKGIYNFGNALHSPLDAYWNSEIYRALRVSSRRGDTCPIEECKYCANTISPNDIRSHIMQWEGTEPGEGLQPADAACGAETVRTFTDPPLVSVIVPTYNRPDQLTATLESILAQTYKPVEIIVVNDGGTDVEPTISSLNRNHTITYVRHGENRGLAAARNTGIKIARGKYIAYLDDDDLFYPRHVYTLVRFLESGKYEVAYTDAHRAHQEKKNGKYTVTKRDVPYSFDFDYDRILTTNFIPVLCFMHRRSCVEETGLFDESLKRLEDWDMWIRMSRKFKFAHIKDLTCEFSWRTDGTTMSSRQMEEFVEARRRIAGKYFRVPPSGVVGIQYSRKAKQSLVSVVILTFNEVEYTKECVDSIRKHTPEAHEIIFVDNGSSDGTVSWLETLVRENAHYKLIQNKTNLGFAKGCNQGIEAASGEYVLLLNNDTVVTKDWLSGMLETLNSAPDIGIVGPLTNHISGIQKIEKVGYHSLEEIENYAPAFREKNRYRRIETRRVVGFCMLFERSLVEKIGLFDESFGTGNFEDDDFCARAALAGYRNVIAGDVFIHHSGSRSFIGNRIDYVGSMTGNRRIYTEKWRAIEQNPDQGRKIRALVAREQGRDRFLRGDVAGAVDLWLSAIGYCPDDPRPYHELSECLIRVKRHQDAVDAIKEAPADTAGVERLVLEGLCREGLNELEAAGNLADRALSMNAVYAPALNLKGILAFRQGAAEEAKEAFEKAATADPSWGEPLTNLGVLLWSAGDRDKSFDFLEKGFILSPHVADLAERYHAAAVSLGLQARAEGVFREARSLYPSSRTIAFLLIDLLISQENDGKAMTEIEAAMAAFETDDGFIEAALAVRRRIGPIEIEPKAGRPALSLCMIVKNEQPNLVRCLSSIRAAVDEIVVVDTGSMDRTKDLATVFGAKVFDFAWEENFSGARNFSLLKAKGDWILVLDADETLSSRDHAGLRNLIRKSHQKIGGYDLTTRNYVIEPNTAGWTANDGSYRNDEAGTGWYASRKVRLFRNDPRIRFSGAVHELVETSILGAGMKIAVCGVPVHHTGKLERAHVTEKGERYFLLGLKKISETGGTPRAIVELAIQAGELGRYDDAIRLWYRYLDGKPTNGISQAYVNLINACLNADRFDEALVEARKAESHANGTRELLLNCAAAEFFAGDVRKAIQMAEQILQKDPGYPPVLGLLAMCLTLAGHEDRGLEYLRQLRDKGIEPRTQILPAIQKLRIAGKGDRVVQLLGLLDRQFPVDDGSSSPPPDRSREDRTRSMQR